MAANIFSCACGRKVLVTKALPRVGEREFCSGDCRLLKAARVRAKASAASAAYGREAAAAARSSPAEDRPRREAERRARQLARSGPKGGQAPATSKRDKKQR